MVDNVYKESIREIPLSELVWLRSARRPERVEEYPFKGSVPYIAAERIINDYQYNTSEIIDQVLYITNAAFYMGTYTYDEHDLAFVNTAKSLASKATLTFLIACLMRVLKEELAKLFLSAIKIRFFCDLILAILINLLNYSIYTSCSD